MKIILLNVVRKTKNYKKFFALIDDEDFERVGEYSWRIQKQPHTIYAVTCINGKNIFLHNFIMGFKGIDHRNGDGLDNRKLNLRKANQRQNCMNRKSSKNTSSKFKGVHWDKYNKKWRAIINHNYKKIHLGYFDSEIEAAKAYDKKAVKLFGEFARLNILLDELAKEVE